MATRDQIQKLAGATNALRPDWPVKSLVTYLEKNHAARAYKDLALALAWLATDEETQNPARLAESGPWWTATRGSTLRGTPRVGPEPGEERCGYAGHEHESAARCRLCAAERAAGDVPERPSEPAPAPESIVRVANAHRTRSGPPTGRTGLRDFAQTEELREPDPAAVARCERTGCGGYVVRDAAGLAAHQAVFGHLPELADNPPKPVADPPR
jgi:hypothetical protein